MVPLVAAPIQSIASTVFFKCLSLVKTTISTSKTLHKLWLECSERTKQQAIYRQQHKEEEAMKKLQLLESHIASLQEQILHLQQDRSSPLLSSSVVLSAGDKERSMEDNTQDKEICDQVHCQTSSMAAEHSAPLLLSSCPSIPLAPPLLFPIPPISNKNKKEQNYKKRDSIKSCIGSSSKLFPSAHFPSVSSSSSPCPVPPPIPNPINKEMIQQVKLRKTKNK